MNDVARSLLLFVAAAVAEIGGGWLIWQGWREHRGLWWIAGGIPALGAYGFVATFQPDPNFGADPGRLRPARTRRKVNSRQLGTLASSFITIRYTL